MLNDEKLDELEKIVLNILEPANPIKVETALKCLFQIPILIDVIRKLRRNLSYDFWVLIKERKIGDTIEHRSVNGRFLITRSGPDGFSVVKVLEVENNVDQ